MKKKTAITLGALALLASGITFGGFKIKEKKEKDKIEQTLKTILIPNAERELNDMLDQDASLGDSIAYYQNLLLQQSTDADGQRLAQKYNKNLGTDIPNMYQDINALSGALKSMQQDWNKEFSKVRKTWNKHYLGMDYDYQGYDSDQVPQSIKDRTAYLKYTIMKNLFSIDTFYIPGIYRQYYSNGQYNDRSFDAFYELEDYRELIYYCNRGPNGYDFYDVLQDLQYALKATKGQFTTTSTNGNRVFYAMTSSEQIKNVLIAVQTVLDNIDNSQKVINPQTLKEAKALVKKLLASVEKQSKLEQQKNNTAKKLDGFKNAQKQLKGKMEQKQQELKNYKSPDVVKRMYKQQRKR